MDIDALHAKKLQELRELLVGHDEGGLNEPVNFWNDVHTLATEFLMGTISKQSGE